MADDTAPPDVPPKVDPRRISGLQNSPFKPGNRLGSGRPKGSRHIITESFLKSIAKDFNTLDPATQEKKGAIAIRKVRENDPSTYLRVIASLQPKDFNINVSPLEAAPDDDLRAQLDQVNAAIRELIGGTITIENGATAAFENETAAALPALPEAIGVSRSGMH